MHPNAFLKAFWRLEVRPEVFVAMSFADDYAERYERVIAPAISSIKVNGETLQPNRVDLSKSGDSILTEILDGIAHSQLVLADVSTCGKDAVSGAPFRNGNVMFEVGVALACRQPEEVLLIRDDKDGFLFDVSTIPHMRLNFTKQEEARARLTRELIARLKERQYIHDSRVRLAVKCLSPNEAEILEQIAKVERGRVWYIKDEAKLNMAAEKAISRLLDKQLIEVAGSVGDTRYAFQATLLGRAAAQGYLCLPKYEMPEATEIEGPSDGDPEGSGALS